MARSGLHPGDERRRGRSGEDREGDDARPGLRGVAALLRTACRVVRGQSCVRRSFRGIAADGDPDRRRETGPDIARAYDRSEEHTSELQSLMRTSYAVFCLKKKIKRKLEDEHD